MFQSESVQIKKIKKGNEQAFARLYEQYADYALRTAFAITKNKYDASDVVQETFIRVYRNIHSFDIKRPFRPWFYRILINECKRHLHKKTTHAIIVESTEVLEFLHAKGMESVHVEHVMLALENLTEDERTLIVLKYLDGFKEKELAEVMELNVNTIKSRLYRARQRLKAILRGGVLDD
ncbi:RNA polymerase sigma factor [Virgibacillus soli]|uniref:RNA polymerase sigma factor n=1 Tax=Paracerasibacillus soli TaxID=480284 RepID=A0ABU5CNT6_9BACI|nr:RNA polymerase sigma factor [Virgibacillus soli]MDY0407474.1 RNA polymerase sigma factor [Virgibacillus soli]